MPKIKTNSGAKKRFTITKNGKVKCGSAFKNHILEKKSSKRKRGLRGQSVISEAEVPKVKKMLPYV
ncbi:MAG: 50S ribosomal protein L35 [Spirochaetes bacterium]|nr:50S ribosomal protein L35 [Spirochaetota bacterium]